MTNNIQLDNKGMALTSCSAALMSLGLVSELSADERSEAEEAKAKGPSSQSRRRA